MNHRPDDLSTSKKASSSGACDLDGLDVGGGVAIVHVVSRQSGDVLGEVRYVRRPKAHARVVALAERRQQGG